MSGIQKAMDIVVVVWVAVMIAFIVWLIIDHLTCQYEQMEPSFTRQILRTIIGLSIGLWFYRGIRGSP